MFSYNNIIEKGEPAEKDCIDTCLDSFHTLPPFAQHSLPGVDCIEVENFLSHEECDALIAAAEKVGYSYWHQKNHDDRNGEEKSDEKTKAVRIVDTIEASFPRLSQLLTDRIAKVAELVPKAFSPDMENADELFERDLVGEWKPYKLSDNLLLGRYHPGGHFMPHIDGSTIVDLNTRSMYTLLIYLNDVEEGGETYLLSGDQCNSTYFDEESKSLRGKHEARAGAVHPKKGSAAFFYHSLLHEASPVIAGQKYICRADLLYKRTPPILTAPDDLKAFQLYEKARITESEGNAMEACKMFQRVRSLSRGVAELYQLD